MPTTKIRAENRPTNARPLGARARPIWPQVGRQEREDLADAESLDHRGHPEDRDDDRASPARPRAVHGRTRRLRRQRHGLALHARSSLIRNGEARSVGDPQPYAPSGRCRMIGRLVTRLVDAQAAWARAAGRLQPPLAVGAVPADAAGQGLPQRDVARPPGPLGGHRRPDRGADRGARARHHRPARRGGRRDADRGPHDARPRPSSALPTTPTPTAPPGCGRRSTRC